MALSIGLVDRDGMAGAWLVIAGSGLGWALGRGALARFQKLVPGATLDSYHGLAARSPLAAWSLFVGFLFVGGFPITPGFLGEDLLLHSTLRIGGWSTAVMGLVFILNGIALARIFVRVSFAGHYREPLPYLRPHGTLSGDAHTEPLVSGLITSVR
jgi:formate hydrogenlyase subunit 3/multisubunit Na+/H+ antiporter MnhD subunit